MATRIGREIRSSRERLGISQETLAERSEITAQFVSLLENGRRLPSLPLLERLASALHADIAEFFVADAARLQTVDEHAVALLRELDEPGRTTAVAILRVLVDARRRGG